MIYVMMALYQEAHGLIRELELKKNTAYAPFEVFDNESAGIRLVVTGVGEIAAAAATAAVCARDGADASDFLINIGCCATGCCKPADRGMDSCCAAAEGAAGGCEIVDRGMDSGSGAANAAQIGDLYLCHKITEQATGKTFYPDILYRHPWKERELVTGMQPLQRTAAQGVLYDMEAAAVYQAGIRFFFSGPDALFEGGIGFRSCGTGENDGGDARGAAGAACKGGRGIPCKSAGGGRRGRCAEKRRHFAGRRGGAGAAFCGAALLADDAGVGAAVYHVCGAYRIRLESGTERMVCAGDAPVQRQAGREGAA